MSFISIIIPTFNRAALLKRALQSVYEQTYRHFEVIVVDDGSTDDTAEMIKNSFTDVGYFFQNNQGVSSARNTGIKHAKGEWLAFLDSDDEWLASKLKKQLALQDANPECKICHTNEQWIRNGIEIKQMKKHKKQGGWIFSHCLPLCVMSPSSILIHHSVFADVGLFDTALPACEDYDMWLRMTAKYPVLFNEEPLIIKYGGHEDQLSKKYWGMDRYRIQALQKIISGNTLGQKNKQQAIAMLLKKCAIFRQGALKRGNKAVASEYHALITRFSRK